MQFLVGRGVRRSWGGGSRGVGTRLRIGGGDFLVSERRPRARRRGFGDRLHLLFGGDGGAGAHLRGGLVSTRCLRARIGGGHRLFRRRRGGGLRRFIRSRFLDRVRRRRLDIRLHVVFGHGRRGRVRSLDSRCFGRPRGLEFLVRLALELFGGGGRRCGIGAGSLACFGDLLFDPFHYLVGDLVGERLAFFGRDLVAGPAGNGGRRLTPARGRFIARGTFGRRARGLGSKHRLGLEVEYERRHRHEQQYNGNQRP